MIELINEYLIYVADVKSNTPYCYKNYKSNLLNLSVQDFFIMKSIITCNQDENKIKELIKKVNNIDTMKTIFFAAYFICRSNKYLLTSLDNMFDSFKGINGWNNNSIESEDWINIGKMIDAHDYGILVSEYNSENDKSEDSDDSFDGNFEDDDLDFENENKEYFIIE